MGKVGFFDESEGVKSNTRLNATILIWSGIVMGFLVLILDKPAYIGIVIPMIALGVGKKLYQKRLENGKKDN